MKKFKIGVSASTAWNILKSTCELYLAVWGLGKLGDDMFKFSKQSLGDQISYGERSILSIFR